MYKVPRQCDCGYETLRRSSWYIHTNRCSKVNPANSEGARVAEKDRQLAEKDRQLAEKDRQLAEKNERNSTLELMLCQQLLESKRKLIETKKRKDNYASKSAIRKRRTEPERRQIAQRQKWRCANPGGGCLLPGELEEYDIDHIVPVWKGGSDDVGNLQALCPACHRCKTDHERAGMVGVVSEEIPVVD